jgi:hypothetical protein
MAGQSLSFSWAGPKDLRHLLHRLHKFNRELRESSTSLSHPYHHHLLLNTPLIIVFWVPIVAVAAALMSKVTQSCQGQFQLDLPALTSRCWP